MLFENYLASYRGMRLTVLGLCLLALIMLIANVILACALAFKKDAVVLVPPRLTEETRLVADRTNAGYEKAWGLFLAQLLGNVTPGSVKFVRTAVEPLLSAEVWQQFVNVVEVQAEEIRLDHISIYFEPKTVIYEEESGNIFVSGLSIIKGPSGSEKRIQRTYEFRFRMGDFQPYLTWIDMYEGGARTQKVKARLATQNRREMAKEEAK